MAHISSFSVSFSSSDNDSIEIGVGDLAAAVVVVVDDVDGHTVATTVALGLILSRSTLASLFDFMTSVGEGVLNRLIPLNDDRLLLNGPGFSI